MTVSQRIAPAPPAGPVSSSTEWDPLEEALVGCVAGPWLETAHDLDALARLLEAEGVRVRRPEAVDPERTYATAEWRSRGVSAAAPRDAVLVVGDELIETPLAWRSRYFDTDGYRALFLEYFRAGARWTAAPRPDLKDELYAAPAAPDARDWPEGRPALVVNESEPILCAADVVRSGPDLFALRSPVTNRSGIEWLRRHLAGSRRVHEIETTRPIDACLDELFLPLAPGKILARTDRIDRAQLPPALRAWDLLPAPPPEAADGVTLREAGGLAHGVLSLDEKRVLVEATQSAMIAALRGFGFEAIPCRLRPGGSLAASLRRATLDVRRRPR